MPNIGASPDREQRRLFFLQAHWCGPVSLPLGKQMNLFTQVLSFLVLLIGSLYFGIMKQPAEMGFAILAGAIGLAFSNIDKIQRFKGAGFEAEMKMVQSIIDKETEPEPTSMSLAQSPPQTNTILSDGESKIIIALNHPNWTWRYSKTVASETGFEINIVENILNELKDKEFVSETKGANGQIWSLTKLGRNLLPKR